jgi:hypothetical protein
MSKTAFPILIFVALSIPMTGLLSFARAAPPDTAHIEFRLVRPNETRQCTLNGGATSVNIDADVDHPDSAVLTAGNWELTCEEAVGKTVCFSIAKPPGTPTKVTESACAGAPSAVRFAELNLEATAVSTEVFKESKLTEDARSLLKPASADRGLDSKPTERVSREVMDTVEILKEIAVDTARKRAFAILRDTIAEELCSNLTREVDHVDHAADEAETVSRRPFLPETCESIKALEIADLSEGARRVGEALRRDAVTLAFGLISERLDAAPRDPGLHGILNLFERTILTTILSGRTVQPRDAQSFLAQLAASSFLKDTKPKVRILLVAVAHCLDSAPCDARSVVAYLRSQVDWPHYDPKEDVDQLLRLTTPVLDAAELMRPSGKQTPEDLARGLVDFFFELVEISVDGADNRSLERVASARKAVSGALASDAGMAWQGVLELIQEDSEADGSQGAEVLQKAIAKLRPVLSVLAANARNLREAEANPANAEALRDARRQALENLIDSMTDRRHRNGDLWVFSVGALVSPQYALVSDPGYGQTKWNIGVPMGLAVQNLPDSWKKHFWRELARDWHFQVSLVDPGQFLNRTTKSSGRTKKEDGAGETEVDNDDEPVDIKWNDFVILGAQVGHLFGTPSDLIEVGLSYEYSPGGSQAGRSQLFLNVGYYVPFLDLN